MTSKHGEQRQEDGFAQICDALGIGSQARTVSTAIANIRNMQHFSDLLHAIEREFFMVPGAPDDDYPDDEPEDECLLNCWGSTREKYIEQFRVALNALAVRREEWDLRGGTAYFNLDEAGVVIDALIEHRASAEKRKSTNSASASDERANMCASLIGRLSTLASAHLP